jgi:putative hydrolase of the HAD superfamily
VEIDPGLVRSVELLCLDAGNTVIFLDHERLAQLSTAHGHAVTREQLILAEGIAKRHAEDDSLVDFEWTERHLPGARGWGKMVGTILHLAGFPRELLPKTIAAIWIEHVAFNLWCLVPDGLKDALFELREAGVRTAVVSNSEGMLDQLFTRLEILQCFDVVVDSGKVGVEKPDARIFEIAMETCRSDRDHTLHLGDIFATDIQGARNAGIRHALVDPYGHFEGRHLDVPRVPGATETARAILKARV